jgi:hypothetical protein
MSLHWLLSCQLKPPVAEVADSMALTSIWQSDLRGEEDDVSTVKEEYPQALTRLERSGAALAAARTVKMVRKETIVDDVV